MVTLTNLEDPSVVYSGDIFWETVRPGLKLTIYGPQGCMTSVMKEVTAVSIDAFLIRTRNSNYLLTKNRQPSFEEINQTRDFQEPPAVDLASPTISAAVRHVPMRKLEPMEISNAASVP